MDVPIIPDNVDDGNKSFSGILDTSVPRVTLNPAATVITINDDEGKYAKSKLFISSVASYFPLNITMSCMPDH